MKNNKLYLLGITALVLIFSMAFLSCGADPKKLAQETYDLGQQALGALFNPGRAAELAKKSADIEKKVAKLSDSDRAIYYEELARLTGQGLGGLLDSSMNLLGGSLDMLEAAGQALDATSSLMEAAEDLSGLTGATPDVQEALDAAQQATDLLRSLGF